jgi:Flp pilus assembly protein TadG
MKQTMLIERLRPAFGRVLDETGSSLVEFALSFLVLMAMIFGIIQVGMIFYAFNFVAEASREAARYASVRGSACTGFSDCGIGPTDGTAVTNFVTGMAYPGINPSSLVLKVSTSWPGSTVANPPNNSPGNPVIVKVSYHVPIIVPLIPQNSFWLSSTSQMWITQ